MGRGRKWRSSACACLGVALACATAAPASASPDQETVLQDDPKIVFHADQASLDRTLERVKDLGVDRIRVSLFWFLVAPGVRSESAPDFGDYGPGWPGSYPPAGWERYDRIVRSAARHGIGVLMSVTGPAPAWAAGGRRNRESGVRPDAAAFGEFMRAAGIRYNGSYSPVFDERTRRDLPLFGAPEPPAQSRIPRVDHWSIWNEPNFPSWLFPPWHKAKGKPSRPVAPSLYRAILDEGWAGLMDSGHGGDTILLGETAPYGPHNPKYPKFDSLLGPLRFTRDLYCLDESYRHFRGAAARVRRCPATREARARFVEDHPALFQASGWAHHAYSLKRAPTFPGRRPGGAPLGAINRLVRALDGSQRRWGKPRRWPVWMTEYGYQTLPPDPYRGIPWGRQASWMSWAEYVTYRNPRLAAFAQFLLVDDAPRTRFSRRDPRRWVTWQSGFFTTRGRKKPAYDEFRRAIHVTPRHPRRGGSVNIFAIFRTAEEGTSIPARIEFRPRGGDWRTLRPLTVTNPRGYLLERVRPPSRGSVRVTWTDPATRQDSHSRGVSVRFRR